MTGLERPAHPSVLVVDDDASIREVAQASLELVGGWRVVTAADGHDAVETAAREAPDVVLLDVMMPGLDGPAVRAALESDTRTADIPVVFMTAKSDGLLAEEHPTTLGLILKPFDPMGLSDEVERLLGWRT